MRPGAPDAERIIVVPPTPADAALTRSILGEAGLQCTICKTFAEVTTELATGAGSILVTEERLLAPDVRALADALAAQPPWSDIPIVMLSTSGADSRAAARAMDVFGNVTVLERPVRVTTLVSALRTAIRARRRQYELRDQLRELQHAEGHLRRQSERLRLLWNAASTIVSRDEPDVMMKALFTSIAPHFGLDAYFNFLVDEIGNGLRLASFAGVTAEQADDFGRLAFGPALRGRTAESARPIVPDAAGIREDTGAEAARNLGFRAYLCSPLVVDGRVLGTLSFASRTRDRFASDDIEFLLTICNYVTGAYDRLRLIRQLRETDRRKDEFLATLAHELRNPLAPIRNALAILRLSPHDESALSAARTMMERQLAQMVRLIDDLLDVSRITRGKLELRRERVDLADVVKSAIEAAKPLIDAAGHSLSVSLPDAPVPLDADPVRLSQVLANLLNNAAKYMDRGGRIDLVAEVAGREALVRVRDTGVGIPPDDLPKIFEMFTQVEQSLERAQGGLGIGLTLVKRLVEMHEGVVEARSEGRGRGSEFIVRLPVAADSIAPSSLPVATSDRNDAAPQRLRVLVADDNRDAADSMALMLRMLGHEVRTAPDGARAIEETRAFRPQVVFLDIGMPRLNGYDAARQLRAEPFGASLHLVALTGWGQEDDKRKAAKAGFDRHYTKPIDPAVLEDLLASIERDRESRRVA